MHGCIHTAMAMYVCSWLQLIPKEIGKNVTKNMQKQ